MRPTTARTSAPAKGVCHLEVSHARAPIQVRHLYLWVLAGVGLGSIVGTIFGTDPILFGITTKHMGNLGMIVIRMLKALAIPLVFLSILHSLSTAKISAGKGWKLVGICLLNVTVAMIIALTLLNLLKPGVAWSDTFKTLAQNIPPSQQSPVPENATLNPIDNLSAFIPASLLRPFLENNLISIILLALLIGGAMRAVKNQSEPSAQEGMRALENCVAAAFALFLQMLGWIIRAIPIAVCLVVADAVGRSGLAVFSSSFAFIAVVSAALLLHALIYYPLAAWLFGGKSPREYFRGGADAILSGASTNSSLAAVPVTLKCLTQKLGVSESSATLSTCIGTNLNNDGITLYEATAALFIAQACGLQLGLGEQTVVILASLMAAAGCAGIPEAGLVVLPLVLGAAGLPEWAVAAAIPLLLPVDWLIARLRSGVNVMSDLLVAIMLDGRKPAVSSPSFSQTE